MAVTLPASGRSDAPPGVRSSRRYQLTRRAPSSHTKIQVSPGSVQTARASCRSLAVSRLSHVLVVLDEAAGNDDEQRALHRHQVAHAGHPVGTVVDVPADREQAFRFGDRDLLAAAAQQQPRRGHAQRDENADRLPSPSASSLSPPGVRRLAPEQRRHVHREVVDGAERALVAVGVVHAQLQLVPLQQQAEARPPARPRRGWSRSRRAGRTSRSGPVRRPGGSSRGCPTGG